MENKRLFLNICNSVKKVYSYQVHYYRHIYRVQNFLFQSIFTVLRKLPMLRKVPKTKDFYAFCRHSNVTTSTWHEKTLRVPIYMRFSQPIFGFNKLFILKHLSKTKNYDKTAIFRTREHILDTKIACFFLF